MTYSIRAITKEELEVPISWAANEGWNPGLHDADAFYVTDPKGFFMGFLDEEPISSISAVQYDKTFGFIGFYIVKPEHRGQGFGFRIWKEAIKYLRGYVIGLDGVLTQQPTYKLSGFNLAYRNIRFEGKGIDHTPPDTHIVLLSQIPFQILLSYDNAIFPATRSTFLKKWTAQPESLAIGYMKNDVLSGYGMVRKCGVGYKVGPLFADDEFIADTLFEQLRKFVGSTSSVFLDVPEIHTESVALAKRYHMNPMFETARMYMGNAPDVPLQKVFGVTSFELG